MVEKIASRVGIALCSVGLMSCGIQPGDYVIYRIASAESSQAEGCYDNGVPPDIADDSSTLRAGSTIIMYRGPEDSYYLDLGPIVLQGTDKGDGAFSFQGKTVDVSYAGGGGGGGGGGDSTQFTDTNTTTMDLTIDNGLVSGTTKTVADLSCEGESCQPEDTSLCTTNGSFVGTEIEDIELNYDVK